MLRDDLLQHQQQVAAAVERAKQITVQELNAIIGVCFLFFSRRVSSPGRAISRVFVSVCVRVSSRLFELNDL